MLRFLCICAGGAAGTGARYLVALAATRWLGSAFPFGTLIVNLTGCFLISAIMHFSIASTALGETARLTLTVGFLGGLTTYSSFNYDTLSLLQKSAPGVGLLNFVVTAAGGLAMGAAGWWVGGRLAG